MNSANSDPPQTLSSSSSSVPVILHDLNTISGCKQNTYTFCKTQFNIFQQVCSFRKLSILDIFYIGNFHSWCGKFIE